MKNSKVSVVIMAMLTIIGLTLEVTAQSPSAQRKESPNRPGRPVTVLTSPIRVVLDWVVGIVTPPPSPEAQRKELPR